MSKKAGNKSEYTLSDNSYSSFNHTKPHVLFIMFMFCLLGGPYKFVYRIRAVQILFFEYNSLILTTGCSIWHLTAKKSLRIWKKKCCSPKGGWGYKKFSNSLEQRYSKVATVIQRFSETGFTRNRPRKRRSKMSSPCAVRQVQKLASKNRCMSAASIALEVAEVHRSACQC